MSFNVLVYDALLTDLVAGNLTSSTQVSGLLAKSTYIFSKSHVLSNITPSELSGGSYARCTLSSTFTIIQINDEIQYTVLTPAIAFSGFTATDWQYIILFKASSTIPYLCVDTLGVNSQAGAAVTLDPGTDPFIRVVAP